jgi:hypothetical protein
VPVGAAAELAAAVVGLAAATAVVGAAAAAAEVGLAAAAGALVGATAGAVVGAVAGALVGAAGAVAGPQAARIERLAVSRPARRKRARRLHNWA